MIDLEDLPEGVKAEECVGLYRTAFGRLLLTNRGTSHALDGRVRPYRLKQKYR